MTASIGAHALEALARRAAEAVCVADARYDCTAKLAQTADLFAQVIASGRFLPQFLTELDDDERRNWVECCPPEEDDAPAAQEETYVRAMPQGRGVWFPPAVRGKNPVPQAGAQTVAVRCLQPLLPCEGIALGCVNLAAHLGAGDLPALDEALLCDTVSIAVHLLDNALDAAGYPDGRCSRMTRATRRIGIGVMGLAEVLDARGLAYDSDEARAFAAGVWRTLRTQAEEASRRLALARGPFPLFAESVYKDGAARRNAALTAQAPDAALAALCGVTPGALPRGEASAEACLRMQAALQDEADGAVLLPVRFASRDEAQRLCALAYSLGCAGVAIDRGDEGRAQPEKAAQEAEPPAGGQASLAASAEGSEAQNRTQVQWDEARFCPNCGRPLQRERGRLCCPTCGPLLSPQTAE